jgi:hypothetical protein
MSTAFFKYIDLCCCAILPLADFVPHADGVPPFPYSCHGFTRWPASRMVLTIIRFFNFADQPPSKKRRLNSTESSEEWNLLWHTFWGEPAPDCFVKESTYIPDLRTLEKVTNQTNYQYLKLPNDGPFPCDLRRMLITETYSTLYARLCEEDKLYTEMPESERLTSLTHSTIVAGQPGTGETLTALVFLLR